MKFKYILGAILMTLAVVFSIQNAEMVSVRFFGWSFEVSLALLIFAVLASGFVGGWALAGAARLRKRKRMAESPLPSSTPGPSE